LDWSILTLCHIILHVYDAIGKEEKLKTSEWIYAIRRGRTHEMTDETSGQFDDGISSISSQFWSRPAETFENEPPNARPTTAPVDDVPKPVPKELLLPALAFTVVNGSVKIHTRNRRGLPSIGCLDKVAPRWVKESPWLFKILFMFCAVLVLAAVALIVVSSLSSPSSETTSSSQSTPDGDFLAELNNRSPSVPASATSTPSLTPTSSTMLQREESPVFAPVSTIVPSRLIATATPTVVDIDRGVFPSDAVPTTAPTSPPMDEGPIPGASWRTPTPDPTPQATRRRTTRRPTTRRPTPHPTSYPSVRIDVNSDSLKEEDEEDDDDDNNDDDEKEEDKLPSVSSTEEEEEETKKKKKKKEKKDKSSKEKKTKKPKDD